MDKVYSSLGATAADSAPVPVAGVDVIRRSLASFTEIPVGTHQERW